MNILEKFNSKNFSQFYHKENVICYIIIASIIALDRITKNRIITHQQSNNGTYINDFINLELTWNTGIGFGLLSTNSNFFYNLITSIIGIVIIVLMYLILKAKFWDKIIFSLVVGGAFGNFYDRFVYRAVPDFIDIHYQNFHWFTFNIADIFISIGIIMLIGIDLILKKE